MKIKLHFLLWITIILSLPACRQEPVENTVVEQNSIAQIHDRIQPNEYHKDTLIIFDIDNTLGKTETNLDTWFDLMVRKRASETGSIDQAVEEILPPFYQQQMKLWLKPIEPETVSVFQKLQKDGPTVVALTAREVFLIYRTFEQLERLGIDFSLASICKVMAPYGKHIPALYLEGIIFAGSHNKGAVLEHWLKEMHYHPSKIIFIDDKLKNVRAVAQAAQKLHIPFVGIRYGRMDEEIKHMNVQQAEKTYQEFSHKHPDSKPLKLTPICPTA